MPGTTVLAEVEDCWRGVAPETGRLPGADDNLFEQDIDSFVFIQFVRELGVRFGVELPLVEIFRNPTFRTVAGHVEREQG
ncbi:acyl carrier protein [Amycolatopsis sp. CA-128772]|uniref:acyl carrier protein n=1 Tax=Amycolatopsis sp. CA-128772 TaxID=2073159 RepID=UPI000CD03B3B|nr:acyl carrier protein [Amycolatopsis sp. CA-128772]